MKLRHFVISVYKCRFQDFLLAIIMRTAIQLTNTRNKTQVQELSIETFIIFQRCKITVLCHLPGKIQTGPLVTQQLYQLFSRIELKTKQLRLSAIITRSAT